MKKIFLFLVISFFSLSIDAQTIGYTGWIDEIDLAGHWHVESIDGNIYGESSFSYFTLNSYGYGKILKNGDTPLITGYFLSNSNKLHLEIKDAPSWSFVVLEYDSRSPRTMKLQTYDGKCTMSWKQTYEENTQSIQTVRKESSPNNKFFNLQGMKIDKPEGIYIQKGQKHIAK